MTCLQHRWARIAIAALLALLLAKSVHDLLFAMLLEAKGPVDGDYLLYAVVGRGILNGLTPYVDLFEARPPGMFLLSAFSMAFTGGAGLANALQVLGIAVLPLLPVLLTAKWLQWRLCSARAAALLTVAFLLGAILSLYTESIGAALQTEFFGAFFACLYVATIAWNRERSTTISILLSSLFLLCSIGIKEPFFLTTAAAAILLSKRPVDFVRFYGVPVLIAAVVGVVVLLVTGWLHAYVDVYLPAILGNRLTTDPTQPFLLRGLAIRRLYAQLISFAYTPSIGLLIALLWLAVPVMKSRTETAPRSALVTAAFALVSLLLMHGAFTVGIYFVAMHLGVRIPLTIAFWKNPLSLAVFAAAWIPLCVLQCRQSRQQLVQTFLMMGCLQLVAFAIGAGGTYNTYHFGFGIPAYFAVMLLFMQSLMRMQTLKYAPIHVAVIVLLLLSVLSYREDPSIRKLVLSQLRHTAVANQKQIDAVDAMLDACHVDRYFSANTYPYLTFARHSPIGPMHQFGVHPYFARDNPLYERTVENVKEFASVFLLADQTVDARFRDLILTQFTSTPPACARPFLPIPKITVLFRET